MDKNKVNIILPERICFLRGTKNEYAPNGLFSPQGEIEYNLYFENFIYPYSADYDIEIVCEYGVNYGRFWRFDGICDEDIFEMKINIFSFFGELVATHTLVVEMYSHSEKTANLMCVGDSMTRAGVYISQVLGCLKNVNSVGTRCYDGKNFAEGRGGWNLGQYFNDYKDNSGISPFLFPKNIDGKKYFGDLEFWQNITNNKVGEYPYIGFEKISEFIGGNDLLTSLKAGDVVYNNGLFIKNNDTFEEINNGFEFNFSKYIDRYGDFNGIVNTSIISILMGANDFYSVSYDDTEKIIGIKIDLLDKMISSIREFNKNIGIILNLPILSGGISGVEYAGKKKRYDYNILSYSKAIIDKWDNDEGRNNRIYVSPMGSMVDCEYGFATQQLKVNKYSEEKIAYINNFVHPSHIGYKQMGDSLLGIVSKLS